jgi:hypothetical protein
MRQAATTARDHGVNPAFLGGNEIYLHIRFADTPLGSNRLEINYKSFGEDRPAAPTPPGVRPGDARSGPSHPAKHAARFPPGSQDREVDHSRSRTVAGVQIPQRHLQHVGVRRSVHEQHVDEVGRGHPALRGDALYRLGQLRRQFDRHLGQPRGTGFGEHPVHDGPGGLDAALEAFVDRKVRANLGDTPRRSTVNVSARPSRRLAAAAGGERGRQQLRRARL